MLSISTLPDGHIVGLIPAKVRKLSWGRFLIFTNGKIFHHPNPSAIARVIHNSPGSELFFNYRTEFKRDVG